MNFFLYPFYHLPIVSFFLISLLHLFFESKFFMTEKSLFPHFISLLLFSCFLSFFYLSSCFVKRIWWAGGQNTSSREIIEGSGGKWPPRSEKKGPLLFFLFEHDRRSELMDLNQKRRMRRLIIFRQGLAAIVCFLWLSDLCVTQTARGTSASECSASSPCGSPFLSPVLLSLCLPSFLNTWQNVTAKIGQLEAVKLNLEDQMVCVEDQWKIVLEKMRKGNSMTWKRKQGKWQIESPRLSSSGKEHMSDCCTRLKIISNKAWAKNQSNDTKGTNSLFTGARWMHPCNLLEWKLIDWKKMRCGLKRDDDAWDWWKSTDGEMDTKRSQMKTTDDSRPKSEKSSSSIY